MKMVLVYLRLYGTCLGQAFKALAKNAWTVVLPIGLALVWGLLAAQLQGLGMVGGIITAFARAAAFSIYTYFVAEIVGRSTVSIKDLGASVGKFFWVWVNVFFVLWIVDLVLGLVLATSAQKGPLLTVVFLMELVALNALPEVIYHQRTYGGLETISRSFKFLQESWIEWFVPNGLVIALLAWLLMGSGVRLLGLIPMVGIVLPVAGGIFFHVLMVFRGFLFEVLDGSSHRQRMFKFRGGDA